MEKAGDGRERQTGFDKSRLSRTLPPFSRLLPSGPELNHVADRLTRAGLDSPNAPSLYFAARLVGFLVPSLVGLLLVWTDAVPATGGLVGGAAAGGLGYMIPGVWLNARVANRKLILRRGIPDVLDLMIVCLKSGLSLPGTIQRVTEEISIAHPLLGTELRVVQREIELGASIERAFRDFAMRAELDVLRSLSTLIRESQRFGAELVVALRTHAENMRYQREQNAEEQAQRASVKILFPMLLLILPAVFVVLAGPAAIQIKKAFSEGSP
jgi:tight adherence protein C